MSKKKFTNKELTEAIGGLSRNDEILMKEVVEIMVQNWEYVVIGILAIDKVVALSPSKWDDLLWTSVKKAIYKLVGRK